MRYLLVILLICNISCGIKSKSEYANEQANRVLTRGDAPTRTRTFGRNGVIWSISIHWVDKESGEIIKESFDDDDAFILSNSTNKRYRTFGEWLEKIFKEGM